MIYEKKTWLDRIAENITGRLLTYEDGSTALVNVERNEGEISQEGDAFSGENMNDFEERIATAFDIVDAGRKVISVYDRFLRFSPSNHKAVVIKAGTKIRTDSGFINFDVDTTCDLSSYISEAGQDYYVHVDSNGVVIASENKTESGYTRIGRFHTLCADVGDDVKMIAPASPSSGIAVGDKWVVKPYNADDDPDFYAFYNKDVTKVTVQSNYDVIECVHPLSGYKAGEILPESIFCLTFRPECMFDDAMVYEKTLDIACDVYLQSGTSINTRSKFNATHTVNRKYYNIQQDFLQVGKRCLSDEEFTLCAIGSNERTAIQGASDKGTVGGHVDTAGRRMISAIGVEEMCGYLWQVLRDTAPTGGSGWVTTDGHASFGQEYGDPHVLLAGARWGDSASCGSRSRNSDDVRSKSAANNGGRGSSRVRRGL